MQKRRFFIVIFLFLSISVFSQDTVGSFLIQYNAAPQKVQNIVHAVAQDWSKLIKSDLPIRVNIEWRDSLVFPISPEGTNTVAAACEPGSYAWGINNKKSGNDTLYPIALAEKLSGKELNNGAPDIVMYINEIRLLTSKAKDPVIRWYYGLDGKLKSKFQYDLYSILLHEFAHGLGFTSNVQMQIGSASKAMFVDAPTVYDYYVQTRSGKDIVNMSGDLLFKAATANDSNLLFTSSIVRLSNDNKDAIIENESPFHVGRAICHFSEKHYQAGDKNALMTTTFDFNLGEVIHKIGPLAAGVLATLGWTEAMFSYSFPNGYYSVDQLAKFSFAKNNYLVDSLYKLHVSLDGFASDTVINMKSTDSVRVALAAFSKISHRVSYYVEATSVHRTTITFPTNAPHAYFSYFIGKDKTAPTINHTPIADVSAKKGSPRDISLLACVFDEGLVDSVWVEYSVNGVKFIKRMQSAANQIYTTTIIKSDLFQENVAFTYKICARDKSGNVSSSAINEYVVFANPNVTFSYSNDFTDVSTISDFKIGFDAVAQKNNFSISDIKDGTTALQTPHGYRNALDWELAKDGERDSVTYTAVLDRLIVLKRGYAYIDFDEIVLVEPGEVGTVWGDQQFWDYVIVEGSKDAGATWHPIDLAGGYDSRRDSAWLTRYYSIYRHLGKIHYISDAVGDASLYRHHQINILANKRFRDGDTIMLRFRLYSDSFTYAWGWAIDNLNIQKGATSSVENQLSQECRMYPNPSSNQKIVVEFKDFQGKDVQLIVSDLLGQAVRVHDYINFSGIGVVDAGLPSGVYTVQLLSNGAVVGSSRLVIQ